MSSGPPGRSPHHGGRTSGSSSRRSLRNTVLGIDSGPSTSGGTGSSVNPGGVGGNSFDIVDAVMSPVFPSVAASGPGSTGGGTPFLHHGGGHHVLSPPVSSQHHHLHQTLHLPHPQQHLHHHHDSHHRSQHSQHSQHSHSAANGPADGTPASLASPTAVSGPSGSGTRRGPGTTYIQARERALARAIGKKSRSSFRRLGTSGAPVATRRASTSNTSDQQRTNAVANATEPLRDEYGSARSRSTPDEEPGGVLANAIPPPISNTNFRDDELVVEGDHELLELNVDEGEPLMQHDPDGSRQQHQPALSPPPTTTTTTTPIPPPPTTTTETTTKRQQQQQLKNTNNISSNNITSKLRNLTESCLFSTRSTSSPTTAVFYASILYTQTRSRSNAYLYARALYANDEKKRAVYLLDREGLLSHDAHHNDPHHHGYYHEYQNDNATGYTQTLDERTHESHIHNQHETTFDEKDYSVWLTLESMLLAAQCLASLGEWDEVALLLEDACRIPQLANSNATPVISGSTKGALGTDEATEAILHLVRYLDETPDQRQPRKEGEEEVHPVARICALRGKAYDEGSNPTRAALFLRLALRIDYKCVDAWIYLCQRHLLTWEKERDLVIEEMNIEEQMRADGGGVNASESGMEWLRDVYFSRLSNSSGWKEEEEDSGHEECLGARNEDLEFSIEDEGQQKSSHLQSPAHMMSMDASSIHFQPSPNQSMSLPRSGIPNGLVNGSTVKRLDHTVNTKIDMRCENNPGKQVASGLLIEQAFQNLHTKHNLSQSPEILTLAATRAYNSYNLPLALHHCQTLYAMDPLCSNAALIQIATLTGLGQKRPLFRLAHALVDAGPKSAVAWYAVGCYYHACGRYDLAQRNFCRATRLDPRSAECWIAFGCSFASCDENDQANACFRAAQRFHAGSHYPMLYMGMEHLRTNNLTLAGHFLRGARNMSQNDPLCCNELGVWAYRRREWNGAVEWFLMALRLCMEADLAGRTWVAWECEVEQDGSIEEGGETNYPGHLRRRRIAPNLTDEDCIEICQDAFWEPTIFNLGQSFRKAKRYNKAIHCFEKCLALCPGKDSTYSALGFTRHIRGDVEEAIEAYHQALSRKPDDPFASEMLNRALHDALDVLGVPSDKINDTNNYEGAAAIADSHYCFGSTSPSVHGHGVVGDNFLGNPSNNNNQSGMSMSVASVSSIRYRANDSDVDMSMS